MAGSEISARVKLDGAKEATKELQALGKEGQKLDGETFEAKVKADTGPAQRDIEGLLSKVDKLAGTGAAELLLTSNAAQITNEIADLVIKLDTLDANDPQVDITVANIAQLSGDLDQISAKAREISDTPIELNTTGAKQGIDDIGKSADSSKSVLANMVGNASQDLGALGGVAGSAGVAIGQMGEYMADAAASGEGMGSILKSFGTVAGPIAAIALATELMSEAMGSAKESAEAHADSVDAWTDAMRAGGDAGDNFAEQMSETGEIMAATGKASLDSIGWMGSFIDKTAGLGKVLGEGAERLGLFGNKIEDITPLLAKAGVTIEQFTDAVTAPDAAAAQDQFAEALSRTTLSGDDQKKLLTALADQQKSHAEATKNSAEVEKVFGTAVEDNSAAIEANNAKMQEAAQRRREFADAMKLAEAGLAQAIDDADALSAAMQRVNETSDLDFSQMALNTVDSFDSMKEALEGAQDAADGWSGVDLVPTSVADLKGIPDELAAVPAGVADMRSSIQTELAAAFETGGIDAYTAKAEFFRSQVLDQFPAAFEAAGASAEDAAAMSQQLAEELGLMPKDIEIMIQLTREEEARAALDAFSSVIGQMPTEVQVAINTMIAEGDVEGALAFLNEQLINRGYDPIILPVDADTSAGEDTVEGFAGESREGEPVAFDADTSAAESSISDVETGDYQATVDTGADTGEARSGISAVERAKYGATINAGADTVRAASDLLDVATRQRNAKIYAVADADAADTRLDTVASQSRTAKITADANTGAAESELNHVARNRTSTITVRTVEHAQGGVVGRQGGIAGEAGAEFIETPDGRMFLTTGPTPVNPGTKVTSARRTRDILRRGGRLPRYANGTGGPMPRVGNTVIHEHVTVNAAVIGNRFDVERTVATALRRYERRNGRRRP